MSKKKKILSVLSLVSASPLFFAANCSQSSNSAQTKPIEDDNTEKYKQENSTLRQQLDEKNTNLEEQIAKNNELIAKIAELVAELQELKNQNDSVENEQATKQNEINTLNAEIEKLQEKLANKDAEISEKNEEIKRSETSLYLKNAEIAAKSQEIANLIDQKRQINNKAVQLQKELEALAKGIRITNKNGVFTEFFEDLVDSSINEYPSIFMTREAAQVYLSTFIQMIGQLNAFREDSKPYNDILYFIDERVWNYETALSNPGTQKFNLELLLDKYKSIYDIKTKTWNIESGRISLLNNTKYINGQNQPYYVMPKNLNELLVYLKPYLDAGVNKFDFYLPEISWQYNTNAELRRWIFKHANKIVFVSDGNAQQKHFIEKDYVGWVNRTSKSYTKTELLNKWNEFQNNPNQADLGIDYRYFFTLDEKFKIYNLEKNYINQVNKNFEARGKSWAKLNVKQYPVNPYDILSYLQFANSDFLEDFFRVNKVLKDTFLDFVVQGKSNYDPNKKNVVFMGSSLFRKDGKGKWRINQNANTYNEIKQYIAKIKELYPPNEYNYFFKHHPSYKEQEAKEYVQLLFGEEAENLAITLDPTLTWEYMMSIDMNNISKNKSILFNSDGTSKTKLYGLQGTTTIILTSMILLNSTFGWDVEKIKTFVDFKDFPLSNTFNMLVRDKYYTNPTEAYNANLAHMDSVYKYFFEIGYFPSKDNWIDMQTFLQRTKES